MKPIASNAAGQRLRLFRKPPRAVKERSEVQPMKRHPNCIGHHLCQCVGQYYRRLEIALNSIYEHIGDLNNAGVLTMKQRVEANKVISAGLEGKKYRRRKLK